MCSKVLAASCKSIVARVRIDVMSLTTWLARVASQVDVSVRDDLTATRNVVCALTTDNICGEIGRLGNVDRADNRFDSKRLRMHMDGYNE